MPELIGLREVGRGQDYTSKFLRIKNSIFTTQQEDVQTKHLSFGEQNGIDKRIEELREFDPSQVDGGQYRQSGKKVTVSRDSLDFKIPVKGSGARDITVQMFQAMASGLIVVNDDHFEYAKNDLPNR